MNKETTDKIYAIFEKEWPGESVYLFTTNNELNKDGQRAFELLACRRARTRRTPNGHQIFDFCCPVCDRWHSDYRCPKCGITTVYNTVY